MAIYYSINEGGVGAEKLHTLLAQVTNKLKTADLTEKDIETRLEKAHDALKKSEEKMKAWKQFAPLGKDMPDTFKKSKFNVNDCFWWGTLSSGGISSAVTAVFLLIGAPYALGMKIYNVFMDLYSVGGRAMIGFPGLAIMTVIVDDNKQAIKYLEERKKKLKSSKNESTCYNYCSNVELI